jgi:hypothetical protein
MQVLFFYTLTRILGYDLNVTNIRLENGTGQYDGRVEIQINKTWGTISNRYFYKSGGAVLCKMLNLQSVYM